MTPARHSLFVLFLLAACGGAGGSSGDRATAPLEPTVRDSAGVALLEYPADALDRAPLVTIDSVPLATFAGDVDDPEQDVSAILFPSFTTRGDLAGYDREDHQLVVLVMANASRRRFGRKGAGPDEFGSIEQLVVLSGDSILLTDYANARLVLADPDSGLIRTIPLSMVKGSRGQEAIGRIADTYLFTYHDFLSDSQPKDGRARHLYRQGTWRTGSDSMRGIFAIPTGWLVQKVSVSKNGVAMTAYGLALSAMPVVAAWGDGFLTAQGEHWQLEQWDTAGRMRRVVRVNVPRQAVDGAVWHDWIESQMRFATTIARSRRDPDSLRADYATMEHVDSLAAYGGAAISPRGVVWVYDRHELGDTTWSATAIAPDGRILGRIVAQPGELPIAWGDDRLAFKTEDADGIATITVKRLIMPR